MGLLRDAMMADCLLPCGVRAFLYTGEQYTSTVSRSLLLCMRCASTRTHTCTLYTGHMGNSHTCHCCMLHAAAALWGSLITRPMDGPRSLHADNRAETRPRTSRPAVLTTGKCGSDKLRAAGVVFDPLRARKYDEICQQITLNIDFLRRCQMLPIEGGSGYIFFGGRFPEGRFTCRLKRPSVLTCAFLESNVKTLAACQRPHLLKSP